MDSAVKRPWYRLHWATWVAIALVIAALAYREQVPQRFDGNHASTDQGSVYFDELIYGWPFAHVVHYDIGSSLMTSDWYWGWFGLNLLCCLVLALSAAAVVETCLRRSRRWQFNIRLLLVSVAIAGILMGLAVQHDLWFAFMDHFGGIATVLNTWEGFTNPILWPMQFALACTIYSLGWLALALLTRAYRLVRP